MRKIEETLGLPSLEDIMKETGLDDVDLDLDAELEEVDGAIAAAMPSANAMVSAAGLDIASQGGQEHEKAMDEAYKDTIQHAKDIVDLGFNTDPAKAARMFEVGAQYYKLAMEAQNSKRDAQLKLIALMQNQQKIAIAEKRGSGDDAQAVGGQVVMVEDRNELLRRLREENKTA